MKLQYMCLDSALDLWPPVILSLDFSLLGSGVRIWSVQPWAFLMYVENFEIDNSLKWVTFHVVSGQITSNALWK